MLDDNLYNEKDPKKTEVKINDESYFDSNYYNPIDKIPKINSEIENFPKIENNYIKLINTKTKRFNIFSTKQVKDSKSKIKLIKIN
jgi:hypothetical protein